MATRARETLDSVLRGRVRVLQHRDGYRFSLDALLLADFVHRPQPARRALDLGTGSGVVALVLAAQGSAGQVVGVEIQPALAKLAQRSVELNLMTDRVTVIEGDLRDRSLLKGELFDLVVSNPPFRSGSTGTTSPRSERALARHEIAAPLPQLLAAIRRLLHSRGRAGLIYPAQRLAALTAGLVGAGLWPTRLRLIHPRAGEAAELCLVEARPGREGPLEILSPLIVHGDSGGYTPDLRRILGDD